MQCLASSIQLVFRGDKAQIWGSVILGLRPFLSLSHLSHGSANLFCKGLIANILGFVSPTQTLSHIVLGFVLMLQPFKNVKIIV